MMRMDGLRHLYRQMKLKSEDRAVFRFSKGNARLEVVFFIDESPFALMISVHGVGGVTFEVPVEKGFMIDTMMGKSDYAALCRALGLEWDPSRPFSPAAFFRELNSKVPSGLPVETPRSDLVGLRNLNVEEADKIYFIGWRKNASTERVTARNLDKTRRLMGKVAHHRSLRADVSSCWTEDRTRRVDDTLPHES